MSVDLLYYDYEKFNLPVGGAYNGKLCSHEYCSAIHSAFLLAEKDFNSSKPESVASHWNRNIIGNKRCGIERLLRSPKYLKSIRYALANPMIHNLWYGFDDVAEHFLNKRQFLAVDGLQIYDILTRFLEAAGGRCIQEERRLPHAYVPVDLILDELEKALGIILDFPAPYKGMLGIINERGIIRSRALWGLYLAWRAAGEKASNILEIGGGLGYAAYYSSLFGAKEYTIVDIPLTLAASANFLGLTKGEENIVLYGQDARDTDNAAKNGGSRFVLVPPNAFDACRPYDIIVNMDSFPEFGIDLAREYAVKIKKSTKKFLSINHEGESYRVHDIFMNDPDLKSYSRFPFWLRKGYVEEFFEFK